MENQTQIKSRNLNLLLVVIFWIYAIIHCIIILYYCITDVDFRHLYRDKIKNLWILSGLFISFLLIAILITVNYCRNNICILHICLIPSIITEIIFVGFLMFFIFAEITSPFFHNISVMPLVIPLFVIESCPNIILFVYICQIPKNKNSQNIDNINNNSPLLNTD